MDRWNGWRLLLLTTLRTLIRSLQPLAGIASLLLGALMIVAGLWPFNFNPPNGAFWIGDRNGIGFPGIDGASHQGGGIVHSLRAMQHSGRTLATLPDLTVEIWLSPGERTTFSRDHILALCDGNHEDRVVVAQWKTHLLLRWLESSPKGLGRWREIGVRDALLPRMERLITISSSEQGTTIYLDGQVVRHAMGLRFPAANRDFDGMHLLLGNSWQVANAWSGKIYGLAIYGDLIDGRQAPDRLRAWQEDPRSNLGVHDIARYAFGERAGERIEDLSGNGNHLLLSKRLPFSKPALAPWDPKERLSLSDAKDIVLNLLGFIPAGFFFMLWFQEQGRKLATPFRLALITVLFGLTFSLTIEIVQVFLPTRDSCVRDVVFNTVGATVGWWLWWIMERKGGYHVRSGKAVGGTAEQWP